MLTARDDVDERVNALDAGVDDYLTKPFNLGNCMHGAARLRSGSYQRSNEPSDQLSLGDLQIQLLERKVLRGEQEISLSQREFDLLCHLVRNADAVQSRQSILEAVWGSPFVGDPNTLDVYLGYLRKKLEKSGQPQLLHTIRGAGFMARVGDPKP